MAEADQILIGPAVQVDPPFQMAAACCHQLRMGHCVTVLTMLKAESDVQEDHLRCSAYSQDLPPWISKEVDSCVLGSAWKQRRRIIECKSA